MTDPSDEIKAFDEAIARTILAAFIDLGEEQVGGFGLGKAYDLYARAELERRWTEAWNARMR